MNRRARTRDRLRAVLAAVVFAFATFAITASPVSLPVPDILKPHSALASFCASNAAFTGRLTGSSSSTTALARTKSPTAYGYISSVGSAWSCTAFYRYSGVAWNLDLTHGRFDWGNLINSTSVACNYVVGSTDYVKANSSTDCPDTDAEYALAVNLASEGVFQADSAHNGAGDFSFVQADCGTYYNGHIIRPQAGDPAVDFNGATVGNRPGSNCDALTIDNMGTSQTITYDKTNPIATVTAPAAGSATKRNTTSYTVQWTATDNVAGFAGTTTDWNLQRWVTTIASPGVCAAFPQGPDPSAGNFVEGIAQTAQNSAQSGLQDARCYKWILTATDQNSNGPISSTNAGTVLIDTTPPTGVAFTAPPAGTTSINTFSYAPTWTATDSQSGIASTSLQRQTVGTTSACSATPLNDGGPSSSASGTAYTLADSTCYQWILTVTNGSGLQTIATSGKVWVNALSPAPDFATPDEGTISHQNTTGYSVQWSESAGQGATITSRSLQQYKGAPTGPTGAKSCPASPTTDGAARTNVSPVSPSPAMVSGNCYRWIQTLTNSLSKTGSSTSGWVVVDAVAPTASITYPEANRPLAGDVNIVGSVGDDSWFKDYQLEYGAGPTPSTWTALGPAGTSQVTNNSLGTWQTAGLSGVFTLRLTVHDQANNSFVVTRTVDLENSGRGDEEFVTRVPFVLGGGYSLDVGVANGEARLTRDLFSIPSFGPPQELGLTYSSLETGATGAGGKFGVGWMSNLTQYLTFDFVNNIVTWHRADGGRVPFGLVAGVWTPLAGHHEVFGTGSGIFTITLKDQTKLTFESTGAGRLTQIDNRFGKHLTVAWSASSATSTDASGRATTIAIDSLNNRITQATDSGGRVWAFGYTGTDLTSITEPDPDLDPVALTNGPKASATTTFGYDVDGSHHLTTVQRTRSRVTGGLETLTWTVGYAAGRATSVSDPAAATTPTIFTYNSGVTDVTYPIDSSGLVELVSTTSRYAFDAWGRVTALVQSPGDGLIDGIDDLTTTTVFDADSNRSALTRPMEASPGSTWTYDAVGNVLTATKVIDAATTVTTVNSYNATNDLLTRSEADNDSNARTITKYTYVSGQLTSVDVNCTTTGLVPPTPASGCTGAGTQDPSTNLITNYAYTANGQLAAEQDPLGRVTLHTYDTVGNELTVVANCTSSGTTPPAPFSSCTAGGIHDAQTNVVTSSAYLAAVLAGKVGLPTSQADALGHATSFTYDALGRLLTEVLPGETGVGATIPTLTKTTTYDELGNTLTSTDSWTPLAGGSASQATTHAYDLGNRETHVADAASGVSTDTDYDAAGNPVTTTTDGVETDRVFDGLGRLLSESIDGSADSHVYDGQGNETSSATADGVQTSRTFNNAGWVMSETVGSNGSTVTTSHAYDNLGREVTTTIDPGGQNQSITSTLYDRPGRVTRVTVAGKATNTGYDRAGNATSVTDPANILTTTVYDPLNRATTVVANDVASPTLPTEDVTTRTYYDAAGKTIALTDPKGVSTRSIPNVRGLAATSISNCTDSGTTPTSNPPSCLGAGTKNDVTNVFTTNAYDGEGAMIYKIVDSFAGGDLNLKSETAMDASGRVQAVRDPMGTIARTLYAGDKVSQTIVNCTNQASPGLPTGNWWECMPSALNDGTWNLITTNAYDAAGNKISETAPNGRVTSYEYDNVNRLHAQVVNDVASPTLPTEDIRTEYFYDDADRQSAVLAPAADGSHLVVTRRVYDTAGRLIRTIANCTNTGTTFDYLNEVAGECTGGGTTDAETNVITSYAYDTAGNRIRLTEPDPSATSGAATVTTEYAYDTDNRLCRVVQNAISPLDLQALTYPCTDAISGGTATANVSTRYTYDGAGNVASMVDAANHTTLYAYDAAAHLTSTTDADGKTIVFAFNGLGQKIRQENRSDLPGTGSVTWTFDGAGRVATRTYGTNPSVDLITPAIPTGLTATAISGNQVNLAWSASADNVGVTKYTIRRGGAIVIVVSGSTTAFSDFSVAGSTPYTYTVDATDAAGNVSGLSSAANATTPAPTTVVTTLSATADTYVDGTNGGTKNNNYGTQQTLSVDANRSSWLKFDASGLVGPISLARLSVVENTGIDGLSSVRSSATTSWTETGLTWNNQPTFGGTSLGTIGSNTNSVRTYLNVTSTVTAPGVYSFVLVTTGTTSTTYFARDFSSASASQLEITSPPVDGTAPSTPTGLTAAVAGPTRVNLAWSASSDAVGVQGYRIYRNGSLLTTVGSTSWSDLGVTGGTGYTYTVAAIDAAGNASGQSTSAGATTSAASATTSYTYDLDGNKLTASDGTFTITATYDRLNRPLTVDDEDTPIPDNPDTTYTYSLTNPSWTDPTGTYLVSLDRLDRPTSVDGPAIAAITTAYRSDGRVASEADPNGNTTAYVYDHLGRETSRTTTAGAATPAALARTYNRAGQVLSEASTITGDPTNGTTTYAYDPLGRLTGFTSPISTTTYGWDAVLNRTSVKVGTGTPTTTTFDSANRPTSDSAGGTYVSDGDGRLASRPGQRLIWDNLGRLTAVYPATGMVALAFYSYDPLDRLRMVNYGSNSRVRFRYVGLTTSVAQEIDDQSGTVLRNIGTGWGGERILDWTGANSNIRYYGTNAHHDTIWTASSTGTVSATLRYDPFGTLTASTGTSLPDFRFQGSWFDATTSLQWVVTRWYAPALGRFLSEDSLLGHPDDPPSRHLYAYAEADPIAHWDPDGRNSIWDWVRWFIDPHDFVVAVSALEVELSKHSGRVFADTLGFATYSIPGGGPNGGRGKPDIAWKNGDRVDVWDVKYDSGRNKSWGRAQLARYLDALDAIGLDGHEGRELPSGGPMPVIAVPGLLVSWHSEGGLILYKTNILPRFPRRTNRPVADPDREREKVPNTFPAPGWNPYPVPYYPGNPFKFQLPKFNWSPPQVGFGGNSFAGAAIRLGSKLR